MGDTESLDECGQQHQYQNGRKKHPDKAYVKGYMSCVMCCVSHVTCCLSLTATAKAITLLLLNPTLCTVDWFAKTQKHGGGFQNTQKIIENLKPKNVQRYANISNTHFDQRSQTHTVWAQLTTRPNGADNQTFCILNLIGLGANSVKFPHTGEPE